MFERCLNKKCDVTVAFAGDTFTESGAKPAMYTGIVKSNESDYIEIELEYAEAVLARKIKDKSYTIFIKKEYIISIMIVE